MLRAAVVAALLLLMLAVPARAQDRWTRVATIEVLPGENSVHLADAWRWNGRFKALHLRAKGGPIVVEELHVYDSECLRQLVKFGPRGAGSSKPVALDRERFIDRAFLILGPQARRAVLEVWGLQSREGAVAPRASRPIGAGFEIDFSVGRQVLHGCGTGLWYSDDQIQLQAQGNDVHVESLKVTYETDQTELIEIDADLRQDARTDVFRLLGSERFRRLELFYTPRPGFDGKARVEVHTSSSPDLLAKSGRSGPPDVRACNYPCAPPIACVHKNTCTPIMILFGTNRERKDTAERVGFGPERGEELSLGKALVTVPRYHGEGKVERPGYWSSLILRTTENPERHFTIPAGGVEIFPSREQFIAAMRSAAGELTDFREHAFIYVHGFKVEFDDALFRAAQMAYDLGVDRNNSRIPFAMPFVFSWPARGGLLDYVTDNESARLAEAHLRSFLELVVTQSNAKYVHLIAHSMGSLPVLNVLAQIGEQRPDIKFNQIVLAAPDVDRKQFLAIAGRVHAVAQNFTLYASSRDEAMLVSRRVHSGLPRAGDVPTEGPVVVRGVDTIDVSGLSTEFLTASHSKYAEDTSLLMDIGTLLRKGVRPPHDRTPVLRHTPIGALEFWVYRK